MANSTVSTLNKVIQWERNYATQYIRESRFYRYMGEDNMPVKVVKDLTKDAGDQITLQLMAALTGAGVTGDTTLEGSEEALNDYGHKVTIDWVRNGVRLTKRQKKMTNLDKLAAARPALLKWSKSNLRDAIISALGMFNTGTGNGTAYASASEATKDAHLTSNSDRFLFGAAVSNGSSNDHSTSLGNVDSTNDKCTATNVSVAKRVAVSSSPIVTPITVMEDEEWWVGFTGTRTFRDFRADLLTTWRDSWDRAANTNYKDNPLYVGGDIVWDSIITRHIPEITAITGVGNGGIDVQPFYLCGVEAVAVAWGQMPNLERQDRDYNFLNGIAIDECRAVEKVMFNSKQHGMVTAYFAGVAD